MGTKREQEGLQGAVKKRKIRSYKYEILGADWGEQGTPEEPGSDPQSIEDQDQLEGSAQPVNEQIIVSVEILVEATYSIVHCTLDNDIMVSKT